MDLEGRLAPGCSDPLAAVVGRPGPAEGREVLLERRCPAAGREVLGCSQFRPSPSGDRTRVDACDSVAGSCRGRSGAQSEARREA